MKITAEFNSNEELLSFISAFGTNKISSQIQGGTCPIPMNKVEVKNENKPTTKVIEVKEEIVPFADKDTYFFHSESGSYWMLRKGEVIPTDIDAQVSIEISKEDYEKETAKADAPKEEPKITKEMVRELFGKLIKAGKQDEAKALTTKYGASRLPEVKEEHYAAIYKEAEALL